MTVESPRNREDLIRHAMARLGEGAIRIPITKEQQFIRVREAVRKYKEFHTDSTDRVFVAHQVTAADKTNGYLTVPETVVRVSRVFPWGGIRLKSGIGLFTGSWNYTLMNPIFAKIGPYDTYTSPMVAFYMYEQHVSLIDHVMHGDKRFTYNQKTNILRIEESWNEIAEGAYLLYEAQVEPDDLTDSPFWGDDWLARYTQCLFKEQWGANVSKYDNVQLPGGHSISGTRIADEAQAEKERLLEELREEHSFYPAFVIG